MWWITWTRSALKVFETFSAKTCFQHKCKEGERDSSVDTVMSTCLLLLSRNTKNCTTTLRRRFGRRGKGMPWLARLLLTMHKTNKLLQVLQRYAKYSRSLSYNTSMDISNCIAPPLDCRQGPIWESYRLTLVASIPIWPYSSITQSAEHLCSSWPGT